MTTYIFIKNVQHTAKYDTIFHSQNSKKLLDASADNRGVTKSELNEVVHLIQNTMQTLTVFEKRFSEQQNII